MNNKSTTPTNTQKSRTNQTPTTALSPKNTKTLAAALIGLVVVLGVIAVLATRKTSTEATPKNLQEMRAVEVSGSALARQAETGPDLAVGQQAPSLSAQTFDGSPILVTPGSKPMVVMFVAHWCSHCQKEVPRVTSWIKQTGLPNGVDLVAVATATAKDLPNYPPSTWLQKAGFPIPTIADDEGSPAAEAYGLSSFPFFVALDDSGKVVKRVSGELSQSDFNALITAARTGESS